MPGHSEEEKFVDLSLTVTLRIERVDLWMFRSRDDEPVVIDEEGIEWFVEKVLTSQNLLLHENEEVGDTIGTITVVGPNGKPVDLAKLKAYVKERVLEKFGC